MYLRGQAGQRGYAMAAVLVAVTVMSIVMTALLPVWRQQAQREKEAELVFRGAQYARAIQNYVNKNRAQPPSIDVLVQQKFLRKKYKDPITGEDFQPIFVGQQPQPGQQGRGGAPGQVGGGIQQPPSGLQGRGGVTPIGGGTQQPQGGLVRVASTSKETSIRVHHGATTYNQWQFFATDDIMGPGAPAGGRGGAPGMGAPGQPGPGGPGRGGPGRGGPGRGGPGVDAPGRGGLGGGPGRGMIGVPSGRGRGQ